MTTIHISAIKIHKCRCILILFSFLMLSVMKMKSLLLIFNYLTNSGNNKIRAKDYHLSTLLYYICIDINKVQFSFLNLPKAHFLQNTRRISL